MKTGRLIIVSNRLPITIVKQGKDIELQSSTGGLATGLSSFYKTFESVWIGWPGIMLKRIAGQEKQIERKLRRERCYPVFLSKYDLDNYYHGYANKTIWPLFHYFPIYVQHQKRFWDGYKKVNQAFADRIVKVARRGDIIWVHDYHLMLLPKLIRERMPYAKIGFFLHIPFPSSEVFRLLPNREEILEGILGADLVGFHTYDYAHHFLESVRRLLGYENAFGNVHMGNREVLVDTFPMGIDFERFSKVIEEPEVKREIARMQRKAGQNKIILSIDRLDYTKGVLERLEAFELFLEKNPQFKQKITYIMVAVPSRTGVEQYAKLKRRIDEMIGRINGRFGTIDWSPIWYLYQSMPFSRIASLYNLADVALVTPLRDGMNLVAKEYVATKNDGRGVLILSELAGAAKELGEAILINPYNKEQIVQALRTALTMDEKQKKERMFVMRERLRRYTVHKWASDFLNRLEHIKKIQEEITVKKLTPEREKILLSDFVESKEKLILLDYDGTLIPFVDNPAAAKPDARLISTLKKLSALPNCNVVIVSGRDKATLNKWFGHLNVDIIAEHGAWLRRKGENWHTIEPLTSDWKDKIRPLLELYVDRTPGSFIEEKEFSLVWHYRKADYRLGLVRSRELIDTLIHLTANMDIGVLEGSKVVEVKKVTVNKGRAVSEWLNAKKWDFVFFAGDDWTDEDVFAVLPPEAYSIKVGISFTKARFSVPSYKEVRSLINKMGRRVK